MACQAAGGGLLLAQELYGEIDAFELTVPMLVLGAGSAGDQVRVQFEPAFRSSSAESTDWMTPSTVMKLTTTILDIRPILTHTHQRCSSAACTADYALAGGELA